MTRKAKVHIEGIIDRLLEYTSNRALEFNLYSPYHMRIMDGGYTVLDIWTTGRYYVLTTDYLMMIGKGTVERGGEKGQVPIKGLEQWLDALFFPESKTD